MTNLALTHCIGIFLDFHSKKLRSMHQVHLEGSFPPKGNIPNQFMCFKRFFIAYVLKLWKLKVTASGLFVFLYLSMLLKMNEVSLSGPAIGHQTKPNTRSYRDLAHAEMKIGNLGFGSYSWMKNVLKWNLNRNCIGLTLF